MRVLLLGARGMLGQALVEAFAEMGLTAWDREELDITDAGAVQKKVGGGAWDVVINAAAYTAVDEAERQREAAFAVNADGVRNLAQTVRASGATLVHYSTDYVFPGDAPEGYAEDAQPGPAVNVYGESKLAGERALRQAAPKFFLVRTAWLYGPGGKNFVDTMLRLGRERNASTVSKSLPALRVVNDQHGSPTFTRDVAQATQALLLEGYAPGVYHAVNSGTTTWYEWSREIFRLAGLEVPVVAVPSGEYPRPARRPERSVLQNTRGPKLRPWQAALEDYLALTGAAA